MEFIRLTLYEKKKRGNTEAEYIHIRSDLIALVLQRENYTRVDLYNNQIIYVNEKADIIVDYISKYLRRSNAV